MYYKNKNEAFCALLDSGAEVSLIYTRVHNTLKEKPKLKKQSAFLQLVKGDSIDIARCASMKYEIGRKKQTEGTYKAHQTTNRKVYLCITKGNEHILNCKFHHVIPSEEIISRDPGLLTANSIVKTSKQGLSSQYSLLTILINLFG